MTAVLEADDLSFAYRAEPVLEHVSFRVGEGEFVALVGPNGSGKSTLLRLLLGLLPLQAGHVRCFGEDPRHQSDPSRIGYVPQRLQFGRDFPATVQEVVASGRIARRRWWRRPRPVDHDAVEHALMSVAMLDQRFDRMADLSGGQQQRVLIAKALAADPALLILDEPIAGVDAASQGLFRDSLVHLLREHNAAVLLVSHELGAVANDLDRVLVLKRSIVFDGPPADLAATGVSLGIHQDDLPLWLEELS
ncbi:MAG: metal ABC transporter ATP-binding protein [Acidimicrobiia bacterium]